ncbi:MAG: hypothetical protein XD60_0480 [Acetothermia bacterium 64_32]|nr:MAG: hypothetical protein XD60_0480 [Acetothermia bacterium 64_32]HAF70450.1 hypothetical protein [Candidatus Acetothermia bacterium]
MTPYTPSLLVRPGFDGEAVLKRALSRCAARGLGGADQLLEALRAGDQVAHSAFRYAVAQEVACWLSQLGSVFRAVYVHGSTVEDRARPSSDVDLIAWTGRKLDAVGRLLALVDLSLAKAYRGLMGRDEPRHLLDVQLVDDEEVELGRGYGAVIRSPWTAPICMWRRP